MKKNKEWLKAQVKDEECELKSVYDNYVPYEKVLIADDVNELINQLDEPELPVIPKFVADWIERSKQKRDKLIGVMLYFYVLGIDSDDINVYINENYETFVRAWLDGYTIEPEPMYLVKVNDQGSCLYLKSMQLYKDVESRTDLNSNFEAWKEKAIKFTNKEQAEGIAKFFNGEVVEVMDNV